MKGDRRSENIEAESRLFDCKVAAVSEISRWFVGHGSRAMRRTEGSSCSHLKSEERERGGVNVSAND